MQVGVARGDALGDLLRVAGSHQDMLAPLDDLLLSVGSGALWRCGSRAGHGQSVPQVATERCGDRNTPIERTSTRGVRLDVPYVSMADEQQVLAAAEIAEAFAEDGERVVGVVVADPFDRGLVYLCALGDPDSDDDEPELAWVAVDAAGLPLSDGQLVREAAALVALCETAEEAALVPTSEELHRLSESALALVGEGRPELVAALLQTRDAAAALVGLGAGLRVARSGTLDQLAEQARLLSLASVSLRAQGEQLAAALSGSGSDAGEPLAQAVWKLAGELAAGGNAARFSDAISGASGAVDAFADDVLDHYRAPLREETL